MKLEIIAEENVTVFRLNGRQAAFFVNNTVALQGQRGLCFVGDNTNTIANELLRHQPHIWDYRTIGRETTAYLRKVTQADIQQWINSG